MSQIHASPRYSQIMKTILLFLILGTAPAIFAEGIASTTTVTATNGKSLPHHGLAVICNSQNGKTFVDLVFRPQKNREVEIAITAVYRGTLPRTFRKGSS